MPRNILTMPTNTHAQPGTEKLVQLLEREMRTVYLDETGA